MDPTHHLVGKRDKIELGFFASSLGADNATGGTGGNADTPSTSLFNGTWVPLTSQTFIGQDWGLGGGSPDKAIDAGEFMFLSTFTKDSSGKLCHS